MIHNEESLSPNFDELKATATKSKSKRLADLLPQIEDALASGVSHQAVLTHLNSVGFGMSMKTYSVILSRVRSRANKDPGTPDVTGRRTTWRDSKQRKAAEAQATAEGSKSTAVPKPNVLDWDPQRPVKW